MTPRFLKDPASSPCLVQSTKPVTGNDNALSKTFLGKYADAVDDADAAEVMGKRGVLSKTFVGGYRDAAESADDTEVLG